jgi:hypothetical protein
MAQGFVQVAPDGGGKQLDNDVVQVPAGTVISDGAGNQTTLAAPQYYFRERVVIADPNNPFGVARVSTLMTGPSGQDYGLTVNLAPGQADLQALYSVLADMDTVLNAMMGQGFLGATAAPTPPESAPRVSNLGVALISPSPQAPPAVNADPWGRQIVLPIGPRDNQSSGEVTITAGTETVIPFQNAITTADPNTYYDLLGIFITNTSATAVRVDIRDQLSTVTNVQSRNGVMPFFVPAGDMRGIAPGGVVIYQSNPGQQWSATVSSAVTDIRVWAMFSQVRTR